MCHGAPRHVSSCDLLQLDRPRSRIPAASCYSWDDGLRLQRGWARMLGTRVAAVPILERLHDMIQCEQV